MFIRHTKTKNMRRRIKTTSSEHAITLGFNVSVVGKVTLC